MFFVFFLVVFYVTSPPGAGNMMRKPDIHSFGYNHTDRRSLCGIIGAHLNLARRRTFVTVLLIRWRHIVKLNFGLVCEKHVETCGKKLHPRDTAANPVIRGQISKQGWRFFRKQTLLLCAVVYFLNIIGNRCHHIIRGGGGNFRWIMA